MDCVFMVDLPNIADRDPLGIHPMEQIYKDRDSALDVSKDDERILGEEELGILKEVKSSSHHIKDIADKKSKKSFTSKIKDRILQTGFDRSYLENEQPVLLEITQLSKNMKLISDSIAKFGEPLKSAKFDIGKDVFVYREIEGKINDLEFRVKRVSSEINKVANNILLINDHLKELSDQFKHAPVAKRKELILQSEKIFLQKKNELANIKILRESLGAFMAVGRDLKVIKGLVLQQGDASMSPFGLAFFYKFAERVSSKELAHGLSLIEKLRESPKTLEECNRMSTELFSKLSEREWFKLQYSGERTSFVQAVATFYKISEGNVNDLATDQLDVFQAVFKTLGYTVKNLLSSATSMVSYGSLVKRLQVAETGLDVSKLKIHDVLDPRIKIVQSAQIVRSLENIGHLKMVVSNAALPNLEYAQNILGGLQESLKKSGVMSDHEIFRYNTFVQELCGKLNKTGSEFPEEMLACLMINNKAGTLRIINAVDLRKEKLDNEGEKKYNESSLDIRRFTFQGLMSNVSAVSQALREGIQEASKFSFREIAIPEPIFNLALKYSLDPGEGVKPLIHGEKEIAKQIRHVNEGGDTVIVAEPFAIKMQVLIESIKTKAVMHAEGNKEEWNKQLVSPAQTSLLGMSSIKRDDSFVIDLKNFIDYASEIVLSETMFNRGTLLGGKPEERRERINEILKGAKMTMPNNVDTDFLLYLVDVNTLQGTGFLQENLATSMFNPSYANHRAVFGMFADDIFHGLFASVLKGSKDNAEIQEASMAFKKTLQDFWLFDAALMVLPKKPVKSVIVDALMQSVVRFLTENSKKYKFIKTLDSEIISKTKIQNILKANVLQSTNNMFYFLTHALNELSKGVTGGKSWDDISEDELAKLSLK